MHAATGAPIPTVEPTTYAPTTGAPSFEPTPEPTGVPTTGTPTAAPTVTPVFSTVSAPEPYTAFQFDPTKNGGDGYFQMSEIEFEGTDGAVIDLSDCTATGPATTGAGQNTAKAIDGSVNTKWCTGTASVLSVDSALVIACSTPKTVVKFRWGTANDVSRPVHTYQCC